jgi:[CysO sulfur-carrier protein]-S-L-cysteine hydrolase
LELELELGIGNIASGFSGTVTLLRAALETLVAHAREEAPNECCGYLRASDGAVDEVFRAVNKRASPYGYEFEFEALRAANELDDAGFEVGIYHSHPKSPAEPSQTDINLAHYPHWRYLIVSLAGEPEVRVWHIADGKVEEESLHVD